MPESEKEKKDISNKADIKNLVDTFYSQVFEDKKIGFVFTETTAIDWEKHMPIIYSFWDSVLFGTGDYKGNPIKKHIDLNQKELLTEEMFDRWLLIWERSIQKLFEGPVAQMALEKAANMKILMLYKIKQSESNNFIQ